MRHFIEAVIYVLANGAERGNDDKQQEDKGATEPIGHRPDCISPAVRAFVKMIGCNHRASVHITR